MLCTPTGRTPPSQAPSPAPPLSPPSGTASWVRPGPRPRAWAAGLCRAWVSGAAASAAVVDDRSLFLSPLNLPLHGSESASLSLCPGLLFLSLCPPLSGTLPSLCVSVPLWVPGPLCRSSSTPGLLCPLLQVSVSLPLCLSLSFPVSPAGCCQLPSRPGIDHSPALMSESVRYHQARPQARFSPAHPHGPIPPLSAVSFPSVATELSPQSLPPAPPAQHPDLWSKMGEHLQGQCQGRDCPPPPSLTPWMSSLPHKMSPAPWH